MVRNIVKFDNFKGFPTTLNQALFTWWRHYNMDGSTSNWLNICLTTKSSIVGGSRRPWLSHKISCTLSFTSSGVFGGFKPWSMGSKVGECSWNASFRGFKSWNSFNDWASHVEVKVCRSSQSLRVNTQIEWANTKSDHNENKNVCHRVRPFGWQLKKTLSSS